jgi:putative ABC transport system substrate-binding protein
MLVLERKSGIAFAAVNRLLAMYNFRGRGGGWRPHGLRADLRDSYRRAATFVDKILKGARPTDLPVEQPSRLSLIVNLRTAKTRGLTFPPSVLAREDKVIQ